MSKIPGIIISETVITASPTTTPGAIDQVIVVGTSTAAGVNVPTRITSATDATTKFPGIAAIALASVKAIFANYALAEVFFFSAKDPANSIGTADPGHLTYGAGVLKNLIGIELSYVLIPEAASIATQSVRTTLFSAYETLCQSTGWIHLFNTALATDTKAKAIAEKALYVSTYGHTSLYYSLPTDDNNDRFPLAAIAVAVALKAGQDNPYRPPAGTRYPIAGVKEFTGYVADYTDFNDFVTEGINLVYYANSIKSYALWGVYTLARDKNFFQINSRIAMSVITRQLEMAVLPWLFESSDPQGFTKREVTRISTSIMEQAYLNKGLSGKNPEDAYKIVEVVNAADSVVQLIIYARFIGALTQITMQLVNTSLIPA